jgi:hypothetical protein
MVNLLIKIIWKGEVRKIDDFQEVIKYGVIMIPGLAINKNVLCTGTIPKDQLILKWLKEN